MPPLLQAKIRPRRIIADFVDVDSQKWRDYAQGCTPPKKWLYQSEARRTWTAEARIGARVESILFVSAEEAALFRQLHPALAARADHYANGVDLEAFCPDAALPRPDVMGHKAIVFTGRMDYWPNVDAVCWFARELWPGLRADEPEAQFIIVGSAPNAEVQALAATPGVIVTGRVARVQDWVQHAAIAVAPMRIGRGIQNKVLEAMAMAKPVVVSPEGLTGINAGNEVIVPRDVQGWRDSLAGLLKNADARRHYGAQARAFVENSFSWAAQFERLDRLIG
jgi:sugar transferase (PEP-CTERM/EpsH1 system associated)